MQHRESDGHAIGDSDEYEYAEIIFLGWLMGHPGARFSLTALAEELGISYYFIEKAVSRSPAMELVQIANEKADKRFVSIAPPLTPTLAGLLEVLRQELESLDSLGSQAKEEFWHRAHQEFRNHNKYSIDKKF